MTTYNLNLTKDYCNHWGFWEAIREILQNGEDQSQINPDNEIKITYDESKQVLIVSNKESILQRKTLLLGATSKKDDDSTIGQFGEGYKIALLVLKKLGKDVTINNFAQNETWSTILEPDSKYDNEEVLKVKIRRHVFKKLPDHNLAFVVKGVSKEDMKIVNKNYLRMDDNVTKFKTYSKNEILLDEKYKGKIFINGLFVQDVSSKTNYEFGYNFQPKDLKLDRDRQTVDSFELSHYSKRMIQEYMEFLNEKSENISDDESMNRVFKMIDSKKGEFANLQFFSPNTRFSEIMADRFKKTNSENVFPVSTQEESDMVNNFYPEVQTKIVSKSDKILLSASKDYETIDAFVESNDIKIIEKKLTPADLLNRFAVKHHDSFSFNYELKKDLEDLINQSRTWQDISATLIDEDSMEDENEDENEKPIEEVKDIEKSELKEREPVMDFDDEIPF